MTNNPKTFLPKIGYVYHYPRLDNPTELFRLDIYIASIPSEKYMLASLSTSTNRNIAWKLPGCSRARSSH